MAILAHEIRNPLAGILGYSELLPDERAAMPGEALQILERIHRDAQRLKRLVDNVLELARVEAGKVEWSMGPVALPDLLRDVKASYDAMAQKKGLEITLEISDELPPALANADRLFQVLSNLLGNALKFTPKKGRITLAARVEQHTPVPGAASGDDDLAAWVPFVEPQRVRTSIRVDVTDTGPGIPPERQRQIFQKFGQADTKTSQGVGLGLYISQEIIKRHGGSIWVDSEPGKGTTFRVLLPLAETDDDARQAEPGTDPARRAARVLIIDDDDLLRGALSRMLEGLHTVEAVASAREALALLGQRRDYDVILCDVMMPEMNGAELYEALARMAPALATRMVFMTGGSFTEKADSFLEGTPCPRLDKPLSKQAVLEAITRVLESSGPSGG
jgi:CheY-like chemotaxis protein